MSRFDFNVQLEICDDLTELRKILQTQMGTIGLQLGAWLVLGNGAGIFFLATAATQGIVDLNAQFNHVYTLFIIGAALAFFAICWSYFVSVPMMGTIAGMQTELLLQAHREQLADDHKREGKVALDFEAEDEAAQQRIARMGQRVQRAWLGFGVAVGIYILSALLLLYGLATPLFGALTIYPPVSP